MTKEVMSTSTTSDTPWSASDVDLFLDGAPRYRSQLTVTADRLTARHVWRTSSGSALEAKVNDWLVTDGETEWSVAAEIFEKTYTQLGDRRYRKTAIVVARQLTDGAIIRTLEGLAVAEAGDWLVRNPGGDVWPVPQRTFHIRYEPVTS